MTGAFGHCKVGAFGKCNVEVGNWAGWALEVLVFWDCIQLVRGKTFRCKATAVALSFNWGVVILVRDALFAAFGGKIGGIRALAWRARQKTCRVDGLEPQIFHLCDGHFGILARRCPKLLVQENNRSVQLRRAKLESRV